MVSQLHYCEKKKNNFFSILTECYKARTRSAPDYNHNPLGRVPVLRPFEPCWENPGSDPRYCRGG